MFLFFILIFFCLICRYPNSHTHYFSCTLLYLFAEANSEAIQEQVRKEPSVKELLRSVSSTLVTFSCLFVLLR